VISLDLIHQALDVNDANLALGNETFEAAGATFVRNRDAPDIYDANHVTNIRLSAPSEVGALFARAEEEYAGNNHRRFDTDHRTHPAVIARLRLEDYERSEGLVMLLEEQLRGTPKEHDIRPVIGEKDWTAFASLKREDWFEYRKKQGRPPDPEVAEAMIRVDRGKCPPVRYFLAYVEGRPAAYFNAWNGIDGLGQVEDLFTHPNYRNQGLATALVHRCVAHCRENGAGPVIIVADPTDTPKHIYARLGFRPVAVNAHYIKRLERQASKRPER
jgi:GNAT superfamily N-acetyltransferase